MKTDFIKIINSIYFLSAIIWALYLSMFSSTNIRGFVLLLIFVIVSQIVVFVFSLFFSFLTRNILDNKNQIKYGVVLFLCVFNLYFLVAGAGRYDFASFILFFAINTLSIFYLIKNRIFQLAKKLRK